MVTVFTPPWRPPGSTSIVHIRIHLFVRVHGPLAVRLLLGAVEEVREVGDGHGVGGGGGGGGLLSLLSQLEIIVN